MAYIIENANLSNGQANSVSSLLVEGGKIVAQSPSLNRYKYMRMDARDFIMTPVHVLMDSNLPLRESFLERKDYYIKNFIKKGSTVVLTNSKISSPWELEMKMKQARGFLSDCPIDYVIGVRVRPNLLSADLIRRCRREKIPAIFLEIDEVEELSRIPWGWIKEALFPYNSPLIPVFSGNEHKKSKQFKLNVWRQLVEKRKIPALTEDLEELVPVSRKALMKIGIVPLKAYLQGGRELSYNFYQKTAATEESDVKELFKNHSDSLAVTVHKGKIIRAGNNVYYRPGHGENVIIKTPGFFSDPD